MKNFINILILFFLFFFNSNGFTQNLNLKYKLEKIEVRPDSSFVNETTIILKKNDKPTFYPIFYDTELEKISELKVFVKKGKRLKEEFIIKTHEEDVKLDYITSKKIKYIEIPANKEVKLNYSVTCKELMYFSSLNFFSYNNIDTLKYQIKIPKKFDLVHKTIYKDSLSFYKIDSIKTNEGFIWNLKIAPKKIESNPLQFFGIYKNIKAPFMRTLVIPNAYKNKPTNYINDWYLKNTTQRKGLNDLVKQKIDDLTLNTTDQSELLNIIYSYIKNNFKYVAIEIGMGAFIPSPVNEVYINKQGDCKDLSNFLSEALKYKGIKSNIALAATFDHISDCDFPSLSSANHVICVAYINGKTILLDPTDPIHKEKTPIESLQDRTILIINPEGGLFYNVKRFGPQQNEIYYQLNLTMDNNMLIRGKFAVEYNGISSNNLNRILRYKGKKAFKPFGEKFYEGIFGNQIISDLRVMNESDKLCLNGNITINGKTFDDKTNKYLFIDFLPRLIESENRETLIDGTYLGNTFYKKVRVKIKMNQPIETFNFIKHTYKEEGIILNLTIKSISNLEIECNYNFTYDHIFISKENGEKTNEILKSFKKIINEPIILKKQKN